MSTKTVILNPRHPSLTTERLEGAVVSAVPSMEARGLIWKSVRMKQAIHLFIDSRMGAEVARIYAVRPTDPDQIDFFESNLYTSDEAEQLPCSARSIIYCPAAAGAVVAAIVKTFAIGQPVRREVLFDIPRTTLLASGCSCLSRC